MHDGFGTLPDNSTTQSTQLTQSTQSTQSTQPRQTAPSTSRPDGGLTTATKAGIAVALIGGILLGILGALGISYWKRKKETKARAEMMDPVGWVESGNPASQVLKTHQCESESESEP